MAGGLTKGSAAGRICQTKRQGVALGHHGVGSLLYNGLRTLSVRLVAFTPSLALFTSRIGRLCSHSQPHTLYEPLLATQLGLVSPRSNASSQDSL